MSEKHLITTLMELVIVVYLVNIFLRIIIQLRKKIALYDEIITGQEKGTPKPPYNSLD